MCGLLFLFLFFFVSTDVVLGSFWFHSNLPVGVRKATKKGREDQRALVYFTGGWALYDMAVLKTTKIVEGEVELTMWEAIKAQKEKDAQNDDRFSLAIYNRTFYPDEAEEKPVHVSRVYGGKCKSVEKFTSLSE